MLFSFLLAAAVLTPTTCWFPAGRCVAATTINLVPPTIFGYPAPTKAATGAPSYAIPKPLVSPTAEVTQWSVIKVYDGDTITVKNALGIVKRIRFSCIDSPELKQAGGVASRNALRAILAEDGNTVFIQEMGKDKYGRTLALVSTPRVLVQTKMLEQGMSYYYWAYSKSCPQAALLQSVEQTAKSNQIGLWAEVNNVYPWIWRHKLPVAK